MKEKIAIIGMAGLFPEAETPQEFWENLIQRKDVTSVSTHEDFGADPNFFYDTEKGKPDKCYSLRGGYIRKFNFDANGYKMNAQTLENLDDLYKWTLHVSRQALADGQYLHRAELLKKCGVIVGNLSFPTRTSHDLFAQFYTDTVSPILAKLLDKSDFKLPAIDHPKHPTEHNPLLSSSPTGIISQALGLGGNHFSLDAACASSLYAVKLACDELLNGNADLMLAGAVSGADPLFIHMGFSIFHAYAPDNQKSAPFDKNSQGLISSEGAGMLLLKRYEDAKRDGDRIYACISGIGLSNDGRGKFLLSPNPKGQVLALQRAYENTIIKPQNIDYLECHATGTPLGDVTEINSIETFYGENAPRIGSAKSNMGHLLTAAGMAGMMKVILSMEHDLIPPTIKISETIFSKNSVINSDKIVQNPTTWSEIMRGYDLVGDNGKKVKFAGVNAFGFGGTNAHVILEQNPKTIPFEPQKPENKHFKMAIIGMDAHFGNCKNLNELYLSIHEGRQEFIPLPPKRWMGMEQNQELLKEYGFENGEPPKGAYITDFEIDLLRFKIQPKEAEKLEPQQTLMLKVADNALKDAGFDPKSQNSANVAVIIAMESELAIHHYLGRWDMGWQVEQALKNANLELNPAKKQAFQELAKNLIYEHTEKKSSAGQHTSFIGNIITARISSLWDFTGASFTISSGENSTFKALEIAKSMLANGEVEAVVIGAVDLAGGFENTISRNKLTPVGNGNFSLSYLKNSGGRTIGEGAGAIVLKRSDEAQKSNDRIYAQIDDINFVQADAFLEHDELASKLPPEIAPEKIAENCKNILKKNTISAQNIGILEVSGNGILSDDNSEIQGVINGYALENHSEKTTAIGSVKSNIGHTSAAAGMASLIKTALCLHYRFIPAIPKRENPKNSSLFEKSPFYFPNESRPWIVEKYEKRTAGINAIGSDGTAVHLLVSEPTISVANPENQHEIFLHRAEKDLPKNHFQLQNSAEKLFLISGNSQTEILENLNELKNQISDFSDKNLFDLARSFYRKFKAQNEPKFMLVIIALSIEKLNKEINILQNKVPQSFETGKPCQTPAGSYFTPKPLGKSAKVVNVYSGSTAAYPNMGKDLFQMFPELMETFEAMIPDYQTVLPHKILYPKVIDDSVKIPEFDTVSQMSIGTSFSAIYTKIFGENLNIKPSIAMGYSMGEASGMWYGLEVWNARNVKQIFHDSPIFNHHVGGELKTLQNYWKMPAEEVKKRWRSFSVFEPSENVRELIELHNSKITQVWEKAYLTFINTPTECVVSGDGQTCKTLLRGAGFRVREMIINNVTHHDFVKSEYDLLMKLHDLPVEKTPKIDFYGGQNYAPLKLDRKTIAENSTQICFRGVDFPKQVNKVYEDGGRIFIEQGPGGYCARWIETILDGREGLAIPANRKKFSDLKNLLFAVARLVSHGKEVNLAAFFEDDYALEKNAPRQLFKKITLGAAPISAILTPENLEKFKVEASEILAQKSVVKTQPTAEKNTKSESKNTVETIEKVTQATLETIGENGLKLQNYHDPNRLNDRKIIWNEDDLREFAYGKIAKVFGEKYSVIDTHSRRVMLPKDPYLLVSRITHLEGATHEFKPSKMTTEYDIPYNSWFSTDGQIPWAVSVESGQCDLMLISYLGIDFQAKGELVYRLLDCTMTFLDDLPYEGQTLRYDISINSFARSGRNLLFFFSYNCYVEDRLVLIMRGGCAGFFSDAELAEGQGVVYTKDELEAKRNALKKNFTPLLNCTKTIFNRNDLLHLVHGNIDKCFGEDYISNGKNPSLRMPPEEILMLDRITKLDPKGGTWGLGIIEAEKDLKPDDWYFPCHFRDDEVLAGSLQAEGGGQLLRFFMLYLGLQRLTDNARFQPVTDIPQKVRCRKEVPACEGILTYRMEVKEIGLVPRPYVLADLEIIFNGKIAVHFENLGLHLREKNDPMYLEKKSDTFNGVPVSQPEKSTILDESHITEFALGSLAKAFGDEFLIYEGRTVSRQPNTKLQFISRVTELEGKRCGYKPDGKITAEYDVPSDAWYFKENASPTMPYSVLMEIALQPCGLMSAYLGSTLKYPDKSMYFRNLDGEGTMTNYPDLRGKTIVNKCVMTSTVSLAGTIIQKFTFAVSCDGEAFYTGWASFGYFPPESLATQAGLDEGKHILPWMEQHEITNSKRFDLGLGLARKLFYQSGLSKKSYFRLSENELDLIDKVSIIANGGKYGKGYIHASKIVRRSDWYFTCHFYQDPVMPGSLGIEAILQALQAYAIQQKLGSEFKNPRFTHTPNTKTSWKYRGQILAPDRDMQLEIHIKSVEKLDGRLNILADAYLWKQTMRIYQVTDLGLAIEEL